MAKPANPDQKRPCWSKIRLRHFLELAILLFGLYGIFSGNRLQGPLLAESNPDNPLDLQKQALLERRSYSNETQDGLLGVDRPPQITANQILLATHSRILLYDYVADSLSILHQGLGVYYGIFAGESDDSGNLLSIWVVTRPHKWREGTEYLTEIGVHKGEVFRQVAISSTFTHDAVRFEDKVFICDTGRGSILELSYPSMEKVQTHKMFTMHDHINTLAPLSSTHIWAVRHNLGKSSAVLVDIATDQTKESLPDIGFGSHGFCFWRNSYVILDSLSGGLLLIDKTTKIPRQIWRTRDSKPFLKGLLVIDDLAIFGKSPQRPRSSRFDTDINVELIAVDLQSGSALWTRKIPTHGLLNIIYSPVLRGGDTTAYQLDQIARNEGHSLQKGIGGHWPSGLPFFDLQLLPKPPPDVHFQLNLTKVDIEPLLDLINSLGPEIWTDEYQHTHNVNLNDSRHNIANVKPGVKALLLIFSGNSAKTAYEFPLWKVFEDSVLPMMEEILGENCLGRIARLQLARMPAGSYIKPHTDVGGYAKDCHRIHVPLTSPEGVQFECCRKSNDCSPVILHPGHVFEINNLMRHKVSHSGQEDRIHLVVDVSEEELPHFELTPGDKCHYVSGDLVCHQD